MVYLHALGLRSDVPDVHYGLATIYFQLKELTAAAHHFRECVRLDPSRATAWINLGAVLNVMEDYDEGIKAIQQGLKIDPGRAEGYYNLGLIYRRKGQFDMAIQAYQEAIHLNPNLPDAHFNLANCCTEAGQYRNALLHYEKALEFKPGWDKPTRGIAHVQQLIEGKTSDKKPKSEGRKALSRSTALLQPIDPIAHRNYLSEIHEIAVAIDENGQEMGSLLLKEIEPAIKELSTCLLYSTRSRTELESCINQFDKAIGHMRLIQQAIKSKIDHLKSQGEISPTL